MMRLEQFQRRVHYLRIYLRHATPRKLRNLAAVENRLLRNDPRLAGLFPHFIFVELANACNLRCPLCQMGLGNAVPRENRMDHDTYARAINPLGEYVFMVFLFNWGEPFLNKDIYRIVAHNTQNNIGSALSTNFNARVDADALVESGLDYLIISADGVTQDVYEKYRKGGSIEKVFENLEALVSAKRRRASKLPVIEWQSLVTRFNEFDIERIRSTALDKGADVVRFANLNFYSAENACEAHREWLPSNPRYRKLAARAAPPKGARRKPCFWLWRTAVINVNGGVTPCCLYDVPDWDNVLESAFARVWNNERYRQARMLSTTPAGGTDPDLVCARCTAPFLY